jgi:hypothetical protein
MSTIPQVDNPSFLTLAAIAKLAQFDKELADLEATDYYKEAMSVFLIFRGDIPRLFIDNQVKEPHQGHGWI